MRKFVRFSIILISIILPLFCISQKNKNIRGYIINLNNDTVQCLFTPRNWKKQPRTVSIIINNKDSVIVPGSVERFSIPSLQITYVSKSFEPVKYIDKIEDATSSKAPETDLRRTEFVKVLYNGRFDLFLYLDQLNKKHFFVQGPENFVELYSHYYRHPGDPRRTYDVPITISNKDYEYVLKILMTPCKTIFSIIENIQLIEEQLKKVFEIYDTCMNSKKDG